MKKISVNNILFILAFSIFLLILFYAYISFCLSDGSLKTFGSDIVLSLINGLFLALVVLVAGIFIEEKRRKEIAIQTGEEEIAKLKNILKNVFNRAKSSLNFLNRTPTFYFDDNWINPMYELLTQNKREWDTFLQEYYRSNPSSKIAEELLNFIEGMERALINAEKLDNNLVRIKLNPGLAASMESGFPGDRINAKNETEFAFWVFRATWAGADSTNIMFGMPSATDQQIRFEKIEGLMNQAASLAKTKEFSEIFTQLQSDRKKLDTLIKRINKLVK